MYTHKHTHTHIHILTRTHAHIQRGSLLGSPSEQLIHVNGYSTPNAHRPFETGQNGQNGQSGQRASNRAEDMYDNVAGDMVVPIRGTLYTYIPSFGLR